MRSKKNIGILIVAIVVLLGIAGAIFFVNKYNNSKNIIEENTSNNIYNEKVDSAIDSVLFAEDYNSLSLDEKKNRMLSILYQLEKDGEILKGSIFYQEKIIWFKYSDGTESGVMLEEWTAGFGGSADISNYVTAWDSNGMPSIPESEIDIYDLTKPYPSLNSTNSKINFQKSDYPYLKEEIINLNLSAKYMFGWCDSNDTSSSCYRYLIDYQENQKVWNNNYLETDIDDYCTIEDFKTGLLNYNIVFIQEHGALYKNTPIICTREEYDKSKYDGDKEHLTFAKEPNGKYYYCIKPSFFEKYYGDGKLKDTIVWIGSCHGYQYSDLVYAFEKCGASAVVGYNESILIEYDKCLQNAFVYDLMYGSTVSEALEFSKKVWMPNDKEFTNQYSRYFGNCGIGTEAKVNINGEKAKLIRLEERQVQLKISVMEDGDTSKLITDKEVEASISNQNLRCVNTKAKTNEEGIVMLEFNTNIQDLVAQTDITLHIDGYQDFIISNYGINTQGNIINEAEAFMKPLESIEDETTPSEPVETSGVDSVQDTNATESINEKAYIDLHSYYITNDVYSDNHGKLDVNAYTKKLNTIDVDMNKYNNTYAAVTFMTKPRTIYINNDNNRFMQFDFDSDIVYYDGEYSISEENCLKFNYKNAYIYTDSFDDIYYHPENVYMDQVPIQDANYEYDYWNGELETKLHNVSNAKECGFMVHVGVGESWYFNDLPTPYFLTNINGENKWTEAYTANDACQVYIEDDYIITNQKGWFFSDITGTDDFVLEYSNSELIDEPENLHVGLSSSQELEDLRIDDFKVKFNADKTWNVISSTGYDYNSEKSGTWELIDEHILAIIGEENDKVNRKYEFSLFKFR